MATDIKYPSLPVFGRRIVIETSSEDRLLASLWTALGILAAAVVVLLLDGFAAPYKLACGAAMLSCGVMVLAKGNGRHIRFEPVDPETQGSHAYGNFALAVTALQLAVIVLVVVQMILLLV